MRFEGDELGEEDDTLPRLVELEVENDAENDQNVELDDPPAAPADDNWRDWDRYFLII